MAVPPRHVLGARQTHRGTKAVPPEYTSSTPALMIVPLAVPPEDTYSLPPKFTVVPRPCRRRHEQVAADIHRGAAGRAAREHILGAAADRGADSHAAGGHVFAAAIDRGVTAVPPDTNRLPEKSSSLLLVTVVPLAVPPENTYSVPPLIVVPPAVPPRHVFVAAGIHRGATGRAGEHEFGAANIYRSADGRAAETRISAPAKLTVVPTAVPPEYTSSTPALMIVPLAVPPAGHVFGCRRNSPRCRWPCRRRTRIRCRRYSPWCRWPRHPRTHTQCRHLTPWRWSFRKKIHSQHRRSRLRRWYYPGGYVRCRHDVSSFERLMAGGCLSGSRRSCQARSWIRFSVAITCSAVISSNCRGLPA